MTPYDQGFRAFYDQLYVNPYPVGFPEYEEFEDGWNDAENHWYEEEYLSRKEEREIYTEN